MVRSADMSTRDVGFMTVEGQGLSVWVHSSDTGLRDELLACLYHLGLTVAGMSGGLCTPAGVASSDVVLLDLDEVAPDALVSGRRTARPPRIGFTSAFTEVTQELSTSGAVAGPLLRGSWSRDQLAASIHAVVAAGTTIPRGGSVHPSERPVVARGADILSGRDVQILECLARGKRTREIAIDLSYAEQTVKNQIHEILVKLGSATRAEAVAVAIRQGLI
jgi:DNA-binding NarL/FixJ family response regulator